MAAADKIRDSLAEHRLNKWYYERWQRDNKVEAPKVLAYLDGGPRPSDSEVPTHYGKGLLFAEDARRELVPSDPPPPPPPPTGDTLRWVPPFLSSPTVRTLTSPSSSIPTGAGGDLRIVDQVKLTSGLGLITGWRNSVWIGGELEAYGNPSSGGHVNPQNNSGVLHFEGIRGKVDGDFFGARFTNPIIQLLALDILVSDGGTAAHADCFQTQYLTCDELRADMGTFRTDYQGFFISNEPQRSDQPLPSKVGKFILSRWNFRPGPKGYPATFVFKAIPQRSGAQPLGPWEFYDVWMPNNNPLYRVYPSGSFVDWAGNPYRHGCFLEQRRHANGNTYPFLRFSTPVDRVPSGPYAGQSCGDCGIGGEGGIWLHPESGGPPGGDFAPANVGLGYVSPGYG